MKQYGVSLIILEGLYQNIEPSEDPITLKTCFLLIELYCTLKLFDKASNVLQYLEKNFPTRCKPDALTQIASSHSVSPDPLVHFPFIYWHYRVKVNTLKPIYGTKPNHQLRSATDTNEKTQRINNSNYPNTANYDEKASNLHDGNEASENVSRRNNNNESSNNDNKKNNAFAPPPSAISAFMKAQIEFLQQRTTTAMQLLNEALFTPSLILSSSTLEQSPNEKSPSNESESLQQIRNIVYYNNLACVHFEMQKYQAAIFYFTKALQENDKVYRDTGLLAPKASPLFLNCIPFFSLIPSNRQKFESFRKI